MADTYTKIADLIDPEVMGDMVSARIPKKLRVAPFAKVDDTWPVSPAIPSRCPPMPTSAMPTLWPRARL